MRSCRCNSFSVKQFSGLMGGGGGRTPRALPLDPRLADVEKNLVKKWAKASGLFSLLTMLASNSLCSGHIIVECVVKAQVLTSTERQRLKIHCHSNFERQRFELSVKRKHNKISSFIEEDHNANNALCFAIMFIFAAYSP